MHWCKLNHCGIIRWWFVEVDQGTLDWSQKGMSSIPGIDEVIMAILSASKTIFSNLMSSLNRFIGRSMNRFQQIFLSKASQSHQKSYILKKLFTTEKEVQLFDCEK